MRTTAKGLAQLIMPLALLLLLAVSATGSGAQPAGQAPSADSSAQVPDGTDAGRPGGLDGLYATVVAGVMLAVAIWFGFLLVSELRRGGPVAIESSWGGFGGGLGGWRLSPGFVYLLGVLVFGAMSSMTLLSLATRESDAGPTSPRVIAPATPASGSSTGRAGGSPQSTATTVAPTGGPAPAGGAPPTAGAPPTDSAAPAGGAAPTGGPPPSK